MSDEKKKYTVVIVDDQSLVRSGYKAILNAYDDIEVVAEATNGEEAIEETLKHQPDIVLMDIRMTKMNGIEATKSIVNDPTCQNTRVLIMTTFDLDEYVYEALRAGAGGFLLKDAEPDEIANAIRTVSDGNALIQPSVMERLVNKFVKTNTFPTSFREIKKGKELKNPLTNREAEILELVAQGLSNQEIGDKLFISPATAKTHIARIMQKTKCHSRAQLVVYYNS